MSKKPAAPSKTMVQEVFALAREMGWTSLSPEEKRLIELLRLTSYHGRNLVVETAIAMRCAYPWVDGKQNANTQAIHPADGRFFVLEKE